MNAMILTALSIPAGLLVFALAALSVAGAALGVAR